MNRIPLRDQNIFTYNPLGGTRPVYPPASYISRPDVQGPYWPSGNPTPPMHMQAQWGTPQTAWGPAYGPSVGVGGPPYNGPQAASNAYVDRTWQPTLLGTFMGANPMTRPSTPQAWGAPPEGVNGGIESIYSTMQARNVDVRGFMGRPMTAGVPTGSAGAMPATGYGPFQPQIYSGSGSVSSGGYLPAQLYGLQQAQGLQPGDGEVWPPPIRDTYGLAPERDIIGGYFPSAAAAAGRLAPPGSSARAGLAVSTDGRAADKGDRRTQADAVPTSHPTGATKGATRAMGGRRAHFSGADPDVVVYGAGGDASDDTLLDLSDPWTWVWFALIITIIVLVAFKARDIYCELASMRGALALLMAHGPKPPEKSEPGTAQPHPEATSSGVN